MDACFLSEGGVLKQGGKVSTDRRWMADRRMQIEDWDRLKAGLQHWLFDNLVVMEENVPLRGFVIV